MVFLSIIIPAHNSQNTIIPLLSSIISSKDVNFHEVEIIVVDDASTDKTIQQAEKFFAKRHFPLLHCCIVSLRVNSGPAKARNIGVKYAKGKIVLFFDADVRVRRNTISEVVQSFKKDFDLFALTGVWDKAQKSKHFFPRFKALRDWSYWINERDPRNYYYLFSTRVAAINRSLFLRLGGFDTTYKAALVEDIELTYRIARRYAVVFDPKVIVHHEFEDFLPVAKKYFWRSYFWSKIYRERKRFDPVATTSKEAITTVSAGLVVGFGFFSVLSYLGHLSEIARIIGVVTGTMLIIHLYGVRKFLWFCLKEEGLWFTVKSFLTGFVLYLIILAGATVSFLQFELDRLNPRVKVPKPH